MATKKPAAPAIKKKPTVAPVTSIKKTPPPPLADEIEDDDDETEDVEEDDPDLAPAGDIGAADESGNDDDEEYSFDIDEAAGLIPDGTVCVLTVSKFEKAVAASSGNNMFNVKALVDESDFEGAIGRSLFRSLVQTEAAKGFTRAFFKAAGQPYKGKFAIKRREIEGAQFGAIIKIKPETDEFDARNEIGRFLTVDIARARIATKTGAAA